MALTRRLDHERNTRLKVLATLGGCSGQEILTVALNASVEVRGADDARVRGLARRGRG